jgi:hypothetical protein
MLAWVPESGIFYQSTYRVSWQCFIKIWSVKFFLRHTFLLKKTFVVHALLVENFNHTKSSSNMKFLHLVLWSNGFSFRARILKPHRIQGIDSTESIPCENQFEAKPYRMFMVVGTLFLGTDSSGGVSSAVGQTPQKNDSLTWNWNILSLVLSFCVTEPVFLNVYGVQELIPRNEFRKPM